jgi:hypothetical protein
MTETLIELLTLIAAGGSGWMASWLFDQARTAVPRPTPATWNHSPTAQRLAWRLLYHPRAAQFTNLALAAALGFGASVGVAWLSGEDIATAADEAISVFFLAPALSYVRHRHSKLAPRTQLQEDQP